MAKVWFAKHATWKQHVFSSLMRFLAGKIDDPVDTLSLIHPGLECLRALEPRKPGIARVAR